MRIEGLTDFQNDLLRTSNNTEAVMKLAVRTSGNIATREVRKVARRKVNRNLGYYYKGFKRGKVYKNPDGYITTRVLNTSNVGHLIEYGHNQVVNPELEGGKLFTVGPNQRIGDFKTFRKVKEGKGIGETVGFVPGKFVLREGIRTYEQSQNFDKEIGKAIDKLLERNGL